MAWIELHQSLVTHKKLLKLRKMLNVRTPMAIGFLCMLWLWAVDNAKDGDLSGLTEKEIADICDFRGIPKNLVRALQESFFIDENMKIHDWEDYAGKLILVRETKRKRDREHIRKKREGEKMSPATRRPTKPNQTQPNQTEPNQTYLHFEEQPDIYLEKADEIFSKYIHKADDDERLRIKILLDDYGLSSFEEAVKRSAGKAKSIGYIEKVLETNFEKKNKNLSFDIDELDKLIKSF